MRVYLHNETKIFFVILSDSEESIIQANGKQADRFFAIAQNDKK
nr:hypothetical protein [Mucilaginibacter sp. X5P1]